LQIVPQLPPALHALQLPAPSQTMPAPQLLPAATLLWLQTGTPVVQLYVPGAQVVPQAVPDEHALQLPLLSQYMFAPQDEPTDFLTWPVQTAVPLLQSKVPGLQSEPQAAPFEQAAHTPLPSHTMPDPQFVAGGAFVCLQTWVPELQS
jgi:hypothetical protein